MLYGLQDGLIFYFCPVYYLLLRYDYKGLVATFAGANF